MTDFNVGTLDIVVIVFYLAGVILLACAGLGFGDPTYTPWASMLGLPLLLAGLALVHSTVKTFGLGSFVLFFVYVGLVVIPALNMVLIGLGFLDSILNFRTRLTKRSE